eukprot:3449906-Rhodomonas_salina.2
MRIFAGDQYGGLSPASAGEASTGAPTRGGDDGSKTDTCTQQPQLKSPEHVCLQSESKEEKSALCSESTAARSWMLLRDLSSRDICDARP